mmetsp:Transcript_1026/g.1801  ORF Transcript_1026/g.1801 Transcript_1026/m.1801 type:complete len:243 (-) Transcript_1026:539-1267(-)
MGSPTPWSAFEKLEMKTCTCPDSCLHFHLNLRILMDSWPSPRRKRSHCWDTHRKKRMWLLRKIREVCWPSGAERRKQSRGSESGSPPVSRIITRIGLEFWARTIRRKCLLGLHMDVFLQRQCIGKCGRLVLMTAYSGTYLSLLGGISSDSTCYITALRFSKWVGQLALHGPGSATPHFSGLGSRALQASPMSMLICESFCTQVSCPMRGGSLSLASSRAALEWIGDSEQCGSRAVCWITMWH